MFTEGFSMLGKQRYYSLTLEDGRILTFPTEQARDEYAKTGQGEHGTVPANFEKGEEE